MALVEATLIGDRTGLVRSPQKIIFRENTFNSTLFGERATLRLRIWQGLLANVPTSDTYVLYNFTAPTTTISTSTFPYWYFEIKDFIREHCTYPTGPNDAKGCWMQWSVDGIKGSGTINFGSTEYFNLGYYSDFSDIEDLLLTNSMDARYAGELPETSYFDSGTGVRFPYVLYNTGNNSIEIESLTSGTLAYITLAASTNSADQINHYSVNESALLGLGFSQSEIDNETFAVKIESSTLASSIKYVKKICRKGPLIQVTFVNRYGAAQNFNMRGRLDQEMTTTEEDYKGQISNAIGDYDTQEHETKVFNKEGRESFTINTGYVQADEIESLKDLVLSERVWVKYNSINYPVVLKTTNFKYRSPDFDKLKNYTFQFEVAREFIQNIA